MSKITMYILICDAVGHNLKGTQIYHSVSDELNVLKIGHSVSDQLRALTINKANISAPTPICQTVSGKLEIAISKSVRNSMLSVY